MTKEEKLREKFLKITESNEFLNAGVHLGWEGVAWHAYQAAYTDCEAEFEQVGHIAQIYTTKPMLIFSFTKILSNSKRDKQVFVRKESESIMSELLKIPKENGVGIEYEWQWLVSYKYDCWNTTTHRTLKQHEIDKDCKYKYIRIEESKRLVQPV